MNQIINKVKKLLRLADGQANEHESAAALAQAQRLIAKHAIEQAMLDESADVDEDLGPLKAWEDPLEAGGRRLQRWKYSLAYAIASRNGCHIYARGGSLMIIGRASDASTVRYLYDYARRQMDRLGKQYKGNGRTWIHNWRLGVIDTISRKLREEQRAAEQEVRGGGAAIVKVDNAIAKVRARKHEAIAYGREKLRLRAGSQSSYRSSPGARLRGRQDGEAIHVGRSPALGRGGSTLEKGS